MRLGLLSENKDFGSSKWVFGFSNLAIAVVFFFAFLLSLGKESVYGGWDVTLAICGLLTLVFELVQYFLILKGKVTDVFFFIIIFSFLFTFGRIFLTGLFQVKTIYSEGIDRPVLDSRFYPLWNSAGWLVLAMIQGQFFGYFVAGRLPKKTNRKKKPDVLLHNTGVVLTIVGVVSLFVTLYGILRGIGETGSYEFFTSDVGLTDDFAICFAIPGVICSISAGVLSKKQSLFLLGVAIVISVVIMVLTGDRRYETTAIITLVALLIRSRKKRIPIPVLLILVVFGIALLNLFVLIRNYRYGGLSFVFHQITFQTLFSFDFLMQTLYEFGNTMLTVVYGLGSIPAAVPWRYGATILSATMNIIPLGFLFQNNPVYQFGYVSVAVMDYFGVTVGASVWADLWGNFSFLCFLFPPLMGLAFRFLDNLEFRGRLGIALKYSMMFFAINLPRASITELLRPIVWASLAIIGCHWIGQILNYKILTARRRIYAKN